MEVYKDNVSRAAQVYVETNLENYTLDSPGKYIVLKGAKIIETGYLDKSIKNPRVNNHPGIFIPKAHALIALLSFFHAVIPAPESFRGALLFASASFARNTEAV